MACLAELAAKTLFGYLTEHCRTEQTVLYFITGGVTEKMVKHGGSGWGNRLMCGKVGMG